MYPAAADAFLLDETCSVAAARSGIVLSQPFCKAACWIDKGIRGASRIFYVDIVIGGDSNVEKGGYYENFI